MSESRDFPPDDTATKMLHIKCVYNEAKVGFSEYTGKWYVEARIDEGGDGILSGICEHADTPQAAVNAYFAAMVNVSRDKYLVTNHSDDRRHWRWNGAAFAQIPILNTRTDRD